jgi:hypothetical protein
MAVVKPVYTAIATQPVATGGVVTTTVTPVVSRLLAFITADMVGATDTTIPAASFVDDAGAAVTTLPTITAEDYFVVYVNGIPQQASLSTLTTANLVLDDTTIGVGVPILLMVTNFQSSSSTLSTPPVISTPTITIS